MARKVLTLGPTRGVHTPGYRVRLYRDGEPTRPITGVDFESVTAIQTAKGLQDLSGTFTITLKDRKARLRVREMDAGTIALRGHYSDAMRTVLKVVVDEVRPAGSADPYASAEDTVITGRCTAKYLQVTSLFLPVWDPEALLPTALTFGYGDAAKKVGSNRPYDINRYLVRKYTLGIGAMVGMSAVPAAAHWIDYKTRFSRTAGLAIPFLQYDENSVAEAFKRLEVLGFTEAWIDELGRQVYRAPGWDAPISYSLPTSELSTWSMPRTDVDVATYVEVIPAGDPGIDSATAQALRAGRAPVPSAYLATGDTQLRQTVDPEFVIETDSRGKVTRKGKTNHWYRLQRRLGLRPLPIQSPLIFNQQQAQAQAEGLLRFSSRMTKGIMATIPGAPELRLGTSIRVHGELEGEAFDRVGYIEHVAHDYVEGSHYLTHFTATHGRDKGDPKWGRMVLPRFDPGALADTPGVLDPAGVDPGPASAGYPLAARGSLIQGPGGTGTHHPGQNWQSSNAVDLEAVEGTAVYAVDHGFVSPPGPYSGFGDSGQGGRFAGKRLHLVTDTNAWFYGHLSQITVTPGQKVTRGQLLGYSGTANSVAHLHLGCQYGNPVTLLGL
jgi:murein DD-endopeptidase MepM/ murein hydrolase activator NlpD